MRASIFVCQAAVTIIVAFASCAIAQAFKREENKVEMDWREKKYVINVPKSELTLLSAYVVL